MLIILPSDWMSVRINMQFKIGQVIKTVQSLLTL